MPRLHNIYSAAQDTDMPMMRAQVGNIKVRYTYARSPESQQSDQPGQDYLEFQLGSSSADNPKFIFAICDGVGSSFMGHIAAQKVGSFLCKELWGSWGDVIPSFGDFGKHLSERLVNFTDNVSKEIYNYEITEDLPALMRTALVKQKEYGSETMFVCGRLINSTLALAWLGDVRIQLLTEQFTPISRFEYVPDTSKRWSSKAGIRGGDLRTFIIDTEEELSTVKHIVAFSDGLASIEHEIARMSSEEIESAIQHLSETPLSDDISFIHFAL